MRRASREDHAYCAPLVRVPASDPGKKFAPPPAVSMAELMVPKYLVPVAPVPENVVPTQRIEPRFCV